MLSKELSSTIFKVFGIEPRSPGPLANTLPTRPIKSFVLFWLVGCFILRHSNPFRVIQCRSTSFICTSLHQIYHVTEAVQSMLWGGRCIGNTVVVVGALTCCALLHSVCDLKVEQMNLRRSLNRELTLYESEVGQNAVEVTKSIYSTKVEGAFDQGAVISKGFHSGCTQWYGFNYSYLIQIHGAFNKFPDFFVQAFKIVVHS